MQLEADTYRGVDVLVTISLPAENFMEMMCRPGTSTQKVNMNAGEKTRKADDTIGMPRQLWFLAVRYSEHLVCHEPLVWSWKRKGSRMNAGPTARRLQQSSLMSMSTIAASNNLGSLQIKLYSKARDQE